VVGVGTWLGGSAAEADALTVCELGPRGGELWIKSKKGKTWSSVAELDGDEGRSEHWDWDDGKDVTEGW
jgi:hypothetical protein